MEHAPISLRTIVGRIIRLVCPCCGRGPVFRTIFHRAECCSECGWRYERCEGHWVGGSEVHMFATFGVSAIVFVPFVVWFDFSNTAVAGAMAGHVVFSLAFFRYSRAIFLGLDFWLDPGHPPISDDDRDSGRSVRGPRGPGGLRRASNRAASRRSVTLDHARR